MALARKPISMLGLLASFGIGNIAQINTVASSISSVFEQFALAQTEYFNLIIGIILAIIIGIITSAVLNALVE